MTLTPSPNSEDRSIPVWSDLLEIFFSPTQVFERRKEDPVILIPLVVLTVVLVLLFYATRSAMEPIFDAEMTRQMAAAMKANPKITPEMVDNIREMQRKWAIFGLSAFSIVAPLLVGFLLWLAGKLVEAREELGAAMMVGVYSCFPWIPETLVGAVQALLLPEEQLNSQYSVKLGVARFLDVGTTSPLTLALVGRIDLFSLWSVALMAIGLSVMGKVTKGHAALAAGFVWLLGNLPAVWGAVRQM